MGRNIYTLDDLNSKTSCFPTVCMETLSPNGYYYELVSSTLGLENFQVYTFSCLPDRFFLYQSSIKRLIEVPAKLIRLSGDESVPEEFLTMEASPAAGSNSNFQHKCTRFSFADIKVYKPHSLCVLLEKPTPEPHCSAPPCIYTGVNDDPR